MTRTSSLSVRLLLVEDHDGDARLLRERLRGIPIEATVERVASLEELNGRAKSLRPDIVLLDLGLPGSRGAETVRRYRRRDESTPVVVLTGLTDPEEATRAIRAGAEEYLVKGEITDRALERTLRFVHERHEARRQLERAHQLSRDILDSLDQHIALIDRDGTITRTNRAWRDFARREGGDPRGYEGENYLAVTRRAAMEEDDAREMLAGLEAVLSGESQRFRLDYPCHGPEERRWFRVTVTPLQSEHGGGAVVSHDSITEQVLAERERARQEHQLESVFDLAPVGIGLTDASSGEIVDVNRAFLELVGYSREEVIGRSTVELGLWPDAGLRERMKRELAEPGDAIRDKQVQFRSRGGAIRHVLLSARRLELDGDEYYLWTNHNITSLVEAKLESLGAHDRLERIVETMAEPLTIVDTDGRIVFANAAAEELFQLSRSEVEERTYRSTDWEITDEEGGPYPTEKLPVSRVLQSEAPVRNVTFAIQRGDGERRVLSVNAAPLREEEGEITAVVTTMRDVTEQRRLEKALRHEALHDPLTDLPNRELFTSRISQAKARARRSGEGFGVVVLDLDRFKVVNDSLGHTAGDRVLVEVAERLRSVLREQDTVARIGGDEFGMLLLGVEGRSGIRRVLGRVRDEFRASFTVGDEEFRLATSTGAHFFRPEEADDGDGSADAAELIRYADIAMFHAKDTGDDGVAFFTPESGEARMRLLQREQELERAIGDGEIVPFYQPLLDFRSGTVVGIETVARWQHPERGLVSPADFIPLAEESGLIVPLGEAVFEQACRDLRALDESNPDRRLRLFVNFSARELSSASRVHHVREILGESGLDPARLTVEVTETALLRGSEQAADLIEIGTRLAVDDFGTGYASLRYLKQFDVSTLKIDRSFVADAPDDPEDRAIIDAIVSLAESLGVETIAEGIETERQEDTVRHFGVRIGQGYRYARPCAVGELETALRSASETVG